MTISQTPIQEHVALIAKHEQEFLAKRTASERLIDSIATFAGSLSFVIVHLAIFIGWAAVNTFAIGRIRHFDPAPYSLLATIVALEAILLASFILMRQSRMSRRSDERDHLMLQILLLTEREITAVLGMERQIARRIGLEDVAQDRKIETLSQDISIADVAQTIQESLASE